MKGFGYVLIAVGLALLLFFLYNFIQENNRTLSPIPENNGVRVVFITPAK